MSLRVPVALDGVIRRYAWGSTTAMQQLLGVAPDSRPAAELWFGAHPDDPSDVPAHGATLADLIADDPAAALGPAVLARFGPQLPFLLKVIAAERPLSIQVHPSRADAQRGFAAEDAAGIARTAANRNYRDPNHKPELLCALTPFEGLCGFRPVGRTLALLDELRLPELAFLRDALRGPDPLRTAFTAVLRHDEPARLATAVASRASAATDGPLRAVRLAADTYPDDVGLVVLLLLNYLRLEPGEAIFLGAGNVHCYLRGTGVEVMANSDNVLRCGFTPKHVDVDELLRVTDFTALAEPRWPSERGAFDVPVPDFRLSRLDLVDIDEPTGLDDLGPSIVLCADGKAEVGEVALSAGRAAFVPADTPTRIAGTGQVFIAGVGTF
ncbi:MAG TPA: mannose-6-phosphate isomerase, class I [Jatrophihabitans sp.]|nr:mannose-6-phosphate isomerase, class I [Jatrophihabitans sp.]